MEAIKVRTSLVTPEFIHLGDRILGSQGLYTPDMDLETRAVIFNKEFDTNITANDLVSCYQIALDEEDMELMYKRFT